MCRLGPEGLWVFVVRVPPYVGEEASERCEARTLVVACRSRRGKFLNNRSIESSATEVARMHTTEMKHTFEPGVADAAGVISWVHFGDLHMTAAGEQNHLDLSSIVDEVNLTWRR